MFLPSTQLRLPVRRVLSLLPNCRPTTLSLNRPPKNLRSFAAPPSTTAELQHTRNIGIIAHIDAVSSPPVFLELS